ncbi:MAG TPA: protein-L-isoaspartate(D-aspartate) O-methyltransferase [Polyangiaceae bacterium]|nr:protein-L-isoaspartate(D-aspartate) O-methyltransferase [Polyangiaceae bacterium]
MVADQLLGRDIVAPNVLAAMATVPRHLFVPDALRVEAYADRPLPIGVGQTISQPYMVAKTIEGLGLSGGERVLEVGAGSGYQAAVLGQIAGSVWAVEIVPELAERARETLAAAGARNVEVICGDGSLGLPERAPFDAIAVAAGAPAVPRALVDQLAPGGRLLVPVGEFGTQSLLRLTRTERGVVRETLLSCAYVPLLGEQGWSSAAGPS